MGIEELSAQQWGVRSVGKHGKWGQGQPEANPQITGVGPGGAVPSLWGAAGTPEDLQDAARGGEGRIVKRTLSHVGPQQPWKGKGFRGRDWGTKLGRSEQDPGAGQGALLWGAVGLDVRDPGGTPTEMAQKDEVRLGGILGEW